MQKTIAALGLGCLVLAGCASSPGSATPATHEEEAYTPTGSNIPRRDARRADVPAVTSSGHLGTLSSGTLMPSRPN